MFDDCFALKEMDLTGFNVAGTKGNPSDNEGLAELIDTNLSALEKVTFGVNFKMTAPDGKSSYNLPDKTWYDSKGNSYTAAEVESHIDNTYGTRTEPETFTTYNPAN